MFKANKKDIAQILANAVNNSKPMGLGLLHYQPKTYVASDFADDITDNGANLDYYDGRMVKLYISRNGDYWQCKDGEARHDYQSWSSKYSTFRDLVGSVIKGVIIGGEENA